MDSKKKLRIILAIVGISFIQGLQFSTSPVLVQIQEHYPDVNVSFVQMLVTAPSLIAMFIALFSGILVLKFSKKSMLLFAALLSGIVGFVPFLADSFWLLFICRVLYGASLGIATALNTAVVAEWFEGQERVQVMGIQAASVGAGMVIVTTVGGALGRSDFRMSYFINIIGFICFALIAVMLPASPKQKAQNNSGEKIRLNGHVFEVSFWCLLEYMFLITFTTNISMHLAGALKGNSGVSGTLTGIFSGSQIVIGLLLGAVTKVAKRYTLPAAMLSFSLGTILLVLFPSNAIMLAIGAVFCGFSQGIFVPTGMVEVSNSVAPIATALASGVFTCGSNLGQTISPITLNSLSKLIFGSQTTSHVYTIAGIGMALAAVLVIFRIHSIEKKKRA